MEYYTDLRRSRSQSSGFVAQKTVMLGEVKAVMAGLDPATPSSSKNTLCED
jgi:hypothetical protein